MQNEIIRLSHDRPTLSGGRLRHRQSPAKVIASISPGSWSSTGPRESLVSAPIEAPAKLVHKLMNLKLSKSNLGPRLRLPASAAYPGARLPSIHRRPPSFTSPPTLGSFDIEIDGLAVPLRGVDRRRNRLARDKHSQ